MQTSQHKALVTGAANGIGQAIAIYFTSQGINVVAADIDETQGALLADNHQNITFIKANMAVEDDILAIFNQHPDIDILINNVGISKFKPLLELSVDEWDTIINTNLRSAFIASREMAKRHQSGSYGRIINIASTRHLMSEPDAEAYAASKGGLVSLTHALAASLSNSGITVNCISPGWIHNGTPEVLTTADHVQHFSGRVGKPQDIANLCWFLCQPENDFINGQNHYVDGGMTKKMIYV